MYQKEHFLFRKANDFVVRQPNSRLIYRKSSCMIGKKVRISAHEVLLPSPSAATLRKEGPDP